MMAVHELGHVIGATATGGKVLRVVWHPLAFSQTVVDPNPRPLVEVWAGPICGIVLPLIAAGVAWWLRLRIGYLFTFFAGFCLLANGAYLGLGVFDRVGDAGDLLWHGTPSWVLMVFGGLTAPAGLWLWHIASPHLGFGGAKRTRPIVARDAYGTLATGVLLVLLAMAVSGCSREAPSPVNAIPAKITLRQRTTLELPGFDNRLLLTIDDITHNQVEVSLAGADLTSLLSPRSMSPHDEAVFEFDGTRYVLALQRLSNIWVGDDFATFTIRRESEEPLSEPAKIERLIQAVAELANATFIRNGAEYDAREAADHLRMKWRAAGDQIATAEQFIEAIASRSSMSGKPYLIRLCDGSEVPAGDYLRQRLGEIDATAEERE